MKFTGLFAGFAFSLLTSVPLWAADVGSPDLCAVSGPNGKIQVEGGAWDVDGLGSNHQIEGVGSFSLPLGCMFGLQVDAGAGSFGDVDALGAGAHLFVRDPNSYLLGVHGAYENWDINGIGNADVWRIGAEAELYAGNFSLEGWVGLQDTDFSGSGVFGKLTAAAYITEDWRVAAGVRLADDFAYGAVSTEWQLPNMPLSLTAEGRYGEDDYKAISIGAKFYFGADQKSLINRHREDDPVDGLFDFLGAAGGINQGTAPAPCVDDGVCDGAVGDAILDGIG
jgi:hypothetical protein